MIFSSTNLTYKYFTFCCNASLILIDFGYSTLKSMRKILNLLLKFILFKASGGGGDDRAGNG